jgi:hypothetical protein
MADLTLSGAIRQPASIFMALQFDPIEQQKRRTFL